MDLLQTTFLKLWQYRHSLNEDYSLDQHLFNIAYTVFVDAFRKAQKGRRIEQTLQQETTEAAPVNDPVEQKEIEYRLHALLERLPAERRKVFMLHRLEGFSYKEVASQLSISVKAVDNHISRTVKYLKEYFVLLSILLLYNGIK